MGWLSHIERLLKFLQEVRALVTNTERNQEDIKYLQGELIEIGDLLKELMFEVKRMQDRSVAQRENDELRMKNFKLEVEILLKKQLSEAENDTSPGSTKTGNLAELPPHDRSGSEPDG
jgi:phage host-nuclease inhibitor protein Gam